jgi:hypothetical protein
MITEIQYKQMIEECNDWYKLLATHRENINKLKTELYFFAPGKTDHDVLEQIEHFHNLFHIELINIHDLKHEIRFHVLEAERHPNFGHRIPHHNLKEKLDKLIAMLEQLEKDFHVFLRK